MNLPDSHPASPTQAILVLVAAVVVPMCLGATYSWSVFVHHIREATGLPQSTAQVPFTVFYVSFPLTLIFAGRLLERFGPQRMAMLGGGTFGAGWFIAGSGAPIGVTAIGVGLIGGLGAGLAYLAPIATGMRWFPHRRGLVTGVAVAGFAGGAALVTKLAGYLMGDLHWTAPSTLRLIGAMCFVVAIPAGSLLRDPPIARPLAGLAAPPPLFLKERSFWILYAAMFVGLSAGFVVISNLAQLNPALADAKVTAVACLAIANALGRIAWGFAFDRLPAQFVLRANLLAQGLLLAAQFWLLRTAPGLYVFAALAGFNYGGVLVLYAATTGRLWGLEHVGRIYGVMFSANMFASLAPLLAGLAKDHLGSFNLPLWAISALAVAAALLLRIPRSPEALGMTRMSAPTGGRA